MQAQPMPGGLFCQVSHAQGDAQLAVIQPESLLGTIGKRCIAHHLKHRFIRRLADNSEVFRAQVEAQPPVAADDPAKVYQGGAFCAAGPFGD